MAELQRLSPEEFKSKNKHKIKVALDDVRSMHNVGSVFRTADAMGIQEVILGGISPRPPHRDIQKAALGATESVDWSYEEKLAEYLEEQKAKGWRIICIEQVHESTPLQDYKRNSSENVILVFGNEVHGVSDSILNISDECIEIPQEGTKHSLNISVSVGVVLWSLCYG